MNSKRLHQIYIFAIALFVASVLSFAAMDAQAQRSQTRLPDISVPPPEAQQQQDSVALNRQNFSDYEVRNPYLKTLIDLHHQIALIDTLIRWQQQVNEIKRSYSQMGVNYQTPKPPERICAQVPANIPCYRAFPDLYPDMADTLADFIPASLPAVEEVMQRAAGQAEMGLEATEDAQTQAQTQARGEAAKPSKAEEEEAYTPNYHWVEVFCAAGKCQAVLANTDKAESRMTVAVGRRLPDGSTVTNIQPSRVVLTYKNELYPLKPAPLDSNRSAARKAERGENSVSREIDDMLKSFPGQATDLIPSAQQENSSSETTSPAATSQQGASDGAGDSGLPDLPGIGETGLF